MKHRITKGPVFCVRGTEMAELDLNIGIIGGGIAGLTAAVVLRQRGAQVTLYEQSDALSEVGAGIQISSNALRVFRALGLKVARYGAPVKPEAVRLLDGLTGANLSQVPMNTGPDRQYMLFHRADLISTLADAAATAGVDIQLSTEAQVADKGNGLFGVQTDEGIADFDVVIAADGVRSPTRAALLGGHTPKFAGQVAWRGVVKAAKFPDLGKSPDQRVYVGPDRHVVVYPLRGGKLVNVVAIQEETDWVAEGWNFHDDAAQMRAAFAGWCPFVTKLLEQVENPIKWGLFVHDPLPTWSKGNAVVIGDAAHPMVPFMAQGACMGVEDAWVLADRLTGATDIPAALTAFAAERLPRTTKVQKTARRNGRLFHMSNPIKRRITHLGLRLIGKVAPDLLAQRFDWIYGHDVTGKGL